MPGRLRQGEARRRFAVPTMLVRTAGRSQAGLSRRARCREGQQVPGRDRCAEGRQESHHRLRHPEGGPIMIRRIALLLVSALTAIAALTGCSHPAPVSYAPVAYGEVIGGQGRCYFDDDAYE